MRHRNMYYLTGQPGWMRFGFSPGWVGRSPSGLGSCAQFLMGGQPPVADQQPRLEFLKSQAGVLEQQLAAIKSQIETLEGEQS